MQQSQRCEVRAATLEDLRIILDIQAASYPAHILEDYDVFASMIKAYPQGISYISHVKLIFRSCRMLCCMRLWKSSTVLFF